MRRLLPVILSLLMVLPQPLKARDADSLGRLAYNPVCPDEVFSWKPVAATGAVFTAGAVVASVPALRNAIDIPLNDRFSSLREDLGNVCIDNYMQYLPSAGYFALGWMKPCRHTTLERGMVLSTAAALEISSVLLVKYTARRLRPDESARNTFPSGHTATAFLGATLVAIEYGGWWGIGAYTLATGVGVMRLYNGRHWFSDVVAGAALGSMCAVAAYWLLPYERKLLGISHGATSLAVVPWAGGVTLSMVF